MPEKRRKSGADAPFQGRNIYDLTIYDLTIYEVRFIEDLRGFRCGSSVPKQSYYYAEVILLFT